MIALCLVLAKLQRELTHIQKEHYLYYEIQKLMGRFSMNTTFMVIGFMIYQILKRSKENSILIAKNLQRKKVILKKNLIKRISSRM